MRQTYHTNAGGLAIVLGPIALLWIFLAATSPSPLKATTYSAGLFLLLFLTLSRGYYLTLDDKILTNIKGLLRKKINVDTITDISMQGAYKVLRGSIKSLYVFYQDDKGNTKYTEIRVGTYKPSTLKLLIDDLKRLNPKIKLDSEAQKLRGQTK